jgi:hypothetical protein
MIASFKHLRPLPQEFVCLCPSLARTVPTC